MQMNFCSLIREYIHAKITSVYKVTSATCTFICDKHVIGVKLSKELLPQHTVLPFAPLSATSVKEKRKYFHHCFSLHTVVRTRHWQYIRK